MRGTEDDGGIVVSIRALGPLEVDVDGVRLDLRRLEARLLLALAWNPNAWIDHAMLSEHVYFDADPRDTTSWRNHLRRALGSGQSVVETRRGRGSRLRTDIQGLDVLLDVDTFHELLHRGDHYLSGGEHTKALDALRQAEACWRGPTPFAELADDVERHASVVALQEERRRCRQTAVRLAIDAGQFATALPELRAMAEEDPADQATIAHLMRASAAIGNPTMAGEYYERLVQLLRGRGEVPTSEVIDLHGRILRDELRPTDIAPKPLDADLTTFIGREGEVSRASHALASSRLVTLVGPPGVGKSRLARELARERTTQSRVWLVQLASCPDGSDSVVRSHLADELGLEHRSGVGLVDELASRLSAPDTLLVLDNCEHVIETLIVLLAGLFSRNQSVVVLATSREPLGIPGEVVLRLSPLSVDDGDGSGHATAMCRDRVRSAGGEIASESVLSEICRELDGLPLAIELIAPEVAVAGPGVALERLRARSLEAPPTLTISARHGSLDAAVGWSVARLDDIERDAVLAAAAFRGGVDAADVAAVTNMDTARASDALLSLAAKSLLRPLAEPGRFEPFEVVRRFARVEARRVGQAPTLEAAHAKWVSSLSASADFPSHRRLIEATHALTWAVTAPADDGINVVDALRHDLYRLELPVGLSTWLASMRNHEGRLGSVATELWATCAFFHGTYANLDRVAHDTLERVAALGEPHRLTRLYVLTAFSFASSGDYEAAADHAAKAEQLAQDVSDDWAFAWAASIDAYQYRRGRHFDQARRRAHEALERFDGMNYPQGRAFPLYTLAIADYREHGDDAGASDLLAVGIRHAIAGTDRLMEATGRLFRAQVLAEQGDVSAAARALIRALECLTFSPHWNLIASSLEYSAVLIAAHGDEDTAVALTSVAAHARWKNHVKTRSRAIPYLSPRVAEPLLALPARPDPRFMTTDPLTVTLQKAKNGLSALSQDA